MPALPYVNLVGEVAKIGMFLTLITNTLLIYITNYHIKNIKGAYKFLVLLLAGLGIVFSVMEIFVHPFMHSFNASFVYFSYGDMFGASKELKAAIVLLYSVICLLIICVIAFQFIYRFFVITNSKYIRLFSLKHLIWWLLYLLICIFVWSYSAFIVLPDKFTIDYLKEEMATEYNQSSADIGGFYIVAYQGSQRSIRVNSIICTLGLSSALMAQYVIIIYCGFKIHFKIRETIESTSGKKYKVQSQLFKTLVIQISAPSIFYHVPAFLMYLVPYLDLKVSVPSGVMVCFFSIYPAIDTLILMWMVTEYHRVIGKLLEKMLNKALNWVKSLTSKADGEVTTATTGTS